MKQCQSFYQEKHFAHVLFLIYLHKCIHKTVTDKDEVPLKPPISGVQKLLTTTVAVALSFFGLRSFFFFMKTEHKTFLGNSCISISTITEIFKFQVLFNSKDPLMGYESTNPSKQNIYSW